MMIEIKGVQFVNKGAELMLVAIKQKLDERLGREYALALSPRNSPFKKRLSYNAHQKIGNLYKRIDWSFLSNVIPDAICRNYGLVKHKDIDVVLDASGFAYGEQWTPTMLAHSVKQAKKMKLSGKHYIFMPQAMGPFKSPQYKKLIKEAVEHCSLMFIRDQISYEYVTGITGVRENVILSPDFTNLVKLNVNRSTVIAKEKLVTLIPNNKMLSKQNNNSFNKRSYIDELVDSALHLQKKGYHVAVLNHEGRGDFELCEKVFSLLNKDDATLLNDLDPISVKEQIRKSDLVICSRFHGCVSALSQNIPVIGTSWSHKYEMLFADYEVSDLVYKFDQSLASLSDNVEKNLDNIRNKLVEYSKIEQQKTEKMWDTIFKLLN